MEKLPKSVHVLYIFVIKFRYSAVTRKQENMFDKLREGLRWSCAPFPLSSEGGVRRRWDQSPHTASSVVA